MILGIRLSSSSREHSELRSNAPCAGGSCTDRPMAECPSGDLWSSTPWTPGWFPAAARPPGRSSVLLSIPISGRHASAMITMPRTWARSPRVDSRHAARPRSQRAFRAQTFRNNGGWPCPPLRRGYPTDHGRRVLKRKPRKRPRSARIGFVTPVLIAPTGNRRTSGRPRLRRFHHRWIRLSRDAHPARPRPIHSEVRKLIDAGFATAKCRGRTSHFSYHLLLWSGPRGSWHSVWGG
jgi:hypothetical protein